MDEYNVKAVSHLLGISPHTLRAWERRYSAITPKRGDTGRRLYSKNEVTRLQSLVNLIRVGHNIGSIANLPDQELEKLIHDGPRACALDLSNETEKVTLSAHVGSLLTALKHFQVNDLTRELQWARVSLSCRDFVLSVISPLMGEVGKLVAERKLSISQEHLLSSVIRNELAQVLYLLQTQKPQDSGEYARILLTTPEGDLHEFGILLSAVLCANYGIHAHYLGPNLPAEALIYCAKSLNSNIVVLGNAPVPTENRTKSIDEYLKEIDLNLPKHVAIWMGGAGRAPRAQTLDKSRSFKLLRSLGELDGILAGMNQPVMQ